MNTSSDTNKQPGAIIIGASSGIGRELAVQLHQQGYAVAVTARREDRLKALCKDLGERAHPFVMDVADTDSAVEAFQLAWQTLGGAELVIVNAGVGEVGESQPLDAELRTLAVNVTGFTAMVNQAYQAFKNQGHGHLVGMSSVAGVRGGPISVYFASKAYVSNYLEGIHTRACVEGLPLDVTDIRPGFVDTPMAQGNNLFWVSGVEKACRQMLSAIRKKKRVVYVTKRWWWVAQLIKILPFPLYKRIMRAVSQ